LSLCSSELQWAKNPYLLKELRVAETDKGFYTPSKEATACCFEAAGVYAEVGRGELQWAKKTLKPVLTESAKSGRSFHIPSKEATVALRLLESMLKWAEVNSSLKPLTPPLTM
jgi:hypothetical protein